jgi:hypothetical protein
MAITSSAGDGVRVTTAAKNGTVKSFTGGKVRLEDPITTGNNGNLEPSPTYADRLILIDGGTGSGQVRRITGQTTGQGDGDDVDLDVHEDWTTDPDGTSTYQISYELDDCATLTGCSKSSKTGVYEFSRELSIGSSGGGGAFAFLFAKDYEGIEGTDDNTGTQPSIIVEDNGRLQFGYIQGGKGISGAIVFGFRNTDAEDFFQFNDGAIVRWYSSVVRSWLADLLWQMATGTTFDVIVDDLLIVEVADNVELRDGSYTNLKWVGASRTADTILIQDDTTISDILMTGMNGFESRDNATTETLEVRNVEFIDTVTRFVNVHDDKTWNFVNAIFDATLASTNILFQVDDLNEVNIKFSLDLLVTEPDGTAINEAQTYVYEGTLNQDLPSANRQDTDANGAASSDVLISKITYPSSVWTKVDSGDWALKVYKWLKLPYVAALANPADAVGASVQIVLNVDPNINETTQATAITAGSGITFNKAATNANTLLSYDTGTIAFSPGDVVTGGTSGASGTVREVAEGDTASGRLFLHTRNATAFQAGEDLEVSAVKRAQATDPLVALDFTWEVRCNSLSLQVVYDYHQARLAEDTPSAETITVIEWGEDEHALMVFAEGSDIYSTKRNVALTEGVFLSGRGTGAISQMTADDGTTYTPPTSVTLELTVKDGADESLLEDVRCVIKATSGGPEAVGTVLMSEETNASGVASEPYNYTSTQPIEWFTRRSSPELGQRYKDRRGTGEITAAGFTNVVNLTKDRQVE